MRASFATALAALLLLPALASAGALPRAGAPDAVEDALAVLPGSTFESALPLREAFRAPLSAREPTLASEPALPSCEPDGDAPGYGGPVLSWPTTCVGAAGNGDERDAFRFVVQNETWLVLTLTVPDGADFDLCVNGPNASGCSTLFGSDDERIERAATPGNWTLTVSAYASAAGNYTLDVRSGTPPAAQDDCGTGGDASNSFSRPTPLVPSVSCEGQMRGTDWRDVYSVALLPGDALAVMLTPNAYADFDLCIFGPTGEYYDCSFASQAGAVESIGVGADQSGNWTIIVDAWSGEGAYGLDVLRVARPAQDDCGTGGDASWREDAPTPLGVPLACAGALDAFDPSDYYALALGEEDHFALSFDGADGTEMDVCVLTPRGYLWWCGDAYDDAVHATRAGGMAGTWLVAVYDAGARGAYSLQLEALDYPPQDDCGIGADAGDDWTNPAPFTFNTTCSGHLHDIDFVDWYALSAPNNTWIRATVAFDDGSTGNVCVYAGRGRCDSDGVALDVVTSNRTTYVAVYRTDRVTANYTLLVDTAPPPPPQMDCGRPGDADSNGQRPIARGERCSGLLTRDYHDDQDVYYYHDAETSMLRARLESATPMTLCVRGPFWFHVRCMTTVNGSVEFDATGDPWWGDEWRLEVYGSGAYNLTLVGAWHTHYGGGLFVAGQDAVGPVSALRPASGVDGVWLDLPQTAVGLEGFSAYATSGRVPFVGSTPASGGNATLTFHGEDGARLGDACTLGDLTVECSVPVGAASVFVTAAGGASWQTSFTYHFLDVD